MSTESIKCCGCDVEVKETKTVFARHYWRPDGSLAEVLTHLDGTTIGTSFIQNGSFPNLDEVYQTPTEVVREFTISRPKYFDGGEEVALAAGWAENEFGFVCPDCAGADDSNHGSIALFQDQDE